MTESLVITRIAHSCHLIQIGGLTVLTDPWFTQRPFYHQGKPIALQPEQLPHLDAVVISHEHYDLKPGQLPTVRRTSPIPVRASVDHLWCLADPRGHFPSKRSASAIGRGRSAALARITSSV